MARQHRGKETQAHILDAAERCFAQSGYDATGVAEICQRAGVSKGAFYHHFPSKQAVFMELLAIWLEDLDLQMESTRSVAGTIPEALLHITEMVPAILEVADTKLPLFLEFWRQAAREPDIWEKMGEHYQRYEAFFGEMIQTGIDEHSFRPMDTRRAARVIISFSIGLIIQAVLDPIGGDWERVAQDGFQGLLRGWELRDDE